MTSATLGRLLILVGAIGVVFAWYRFAVLGRSQTYRGLLTVFALAGVSVQPLLFAAYVASIQGAPFADRLHKFQRYARPDFYISLGVLITGLAGQRGTRLVVCIASLVFEAVWYMLALSV